MSTPSSDATTTNKQSALNNRDSNHTQSVSYKTTQPQPQFSQSRSSTTQINIPILRNALSLNFGTLDTDYFTQDVTVRVGEQQSMPLHVFAQLHELTTGNLPLTLQSFRRMWKTLLLKRVQDIMEMQSNVRPEHHVNMSREILIPAPLHDLLTSLGTFKSKRLGITYNLVQPVYPNRDAPDWWEVHNATLRSWTNLMHRMKHAYTMHLFPDPDITTGTPLPHVTILDNADHTLRSVRCFTDEPSPSDSLIRFCNDDLFDPFDAVTYEDSHLNVVQLKDLNSVQTAYAASYATGLAL